MDRKGRMVLNAPTIKDFNLTLGKNEIDYVLKGNTLTKKIMGTRYKNLLMVIPLIETENNKTTLMETQPLNDENVIVGALVIQTPLGSITATVNNIIKLILYSFTVAIIAASILSYSFSKRITKPLEDMEQAANKVVGGVFKKVSIPENISTEIMHLTKTFNYAITQINETLKKKKHLEKMRKEFVANVSHEFRAPLTSIKGFLELIKEQNLSKEEIKEYTKIMYQDTEYLEYLLSDLLILSKLESNNLNLSRKYINPEKLLRVLKTMKNKINEKKINIETEIDNNLPLLYVDINRIHQVLINLIDNAINYSPKMGTITVKIKKLNTERKLNNYVKFSISDQGPGIPEREQKNIWQRFYKLDRARTRKKRKGSGLGLAIVKDIIEKHGGEIGLESKPGNGSTFFFIL
jgi:signal transduction histidine kinase